MDTNEVKHASDRELLEEILKHTRSTKNYIKWQLIITVAFVVLPLIAAIAVVPMVIKELGNVYGGGTDILQGLK